MADSASSGSENSMYSDSRPRIYPGSNPCSKNFGASLADVQPPNQRSLEQAVELLQSNEEDRETARKAVAIVLRATRKRGFRGAVALCTEVTSLLEQNRRLQHTVSLQKRELLRFQSSQKSPSLCSTSSRSHCRRSTESKGNQIRPVLVNRSTSPLLKEVYVKGTRNQVTQTERSSIDEQRRVLHDTSDKVQEETLMLLRNELSIVKNELESLKKNGTLRQIAADGQTDTSRAALPHSKYIDHSQLQRKGKAMFPESTTQRQGGHTNSEVELPHLPQAKLPGQTLDTCSKSRVCQHVQRKKAFRPFSSPVKVVPDLGGQRQPIRPVDMYSQCKCPGCARVLCKEIVTVFNESRHTTDKKSPEQSEISPRIGDHVVVQSNLTGVVKYIGTVSGEKQQYVGLHLDAPVGNHSGSLNGVQYFSCPPNYGAFVPVYEVLCITSSQSSKVKENLGLSS